MSSLIPNLKTSVGKKIIMGLTGLFLVLFTLGHLIGNSLIIFKGAEMFNSYGHHLITNPLIYLIEAIVVIIFLTHIWTGLTLAWENWRARPIGYQFKHKEIQQATFASSTMPYTGTIFFIFLILHIVFIKYGAHYVVTYEGVEMRDLYKLLLEVFASPINVVGYVVAMLAIGFHVSHGFWSLFQTLGLNHPRYMPGIRVLSKLYGFVVAVGFSSLPIYCYLQGVH